MLNTKFKSKWLDLVRTSIHCVVISIVCVSALTLIGGESIAQSEQVRRPDFLDEMPSVERIQREVKGTSDLDTKIRQRAAFEVLIDFMKVQRGAAGRQGPRHPSDTIGGEYYSQLVRLNRELKTEIVGTGQPTAEQGARWTRTYEQIIDFKSSADFQKQLLVQFFSPQWIASYQQKKASQTAEIESYQRKTYPGQTSSLNPQTTAKPDPSVAQAKAAGVDTRVFGVPLGEPLRLPDCANVKNRESSRGVDILGALQGIQTSTTCQSEGSMIALVGALVGGKPADRYILLAKNSCPYWAFCEVMARLYEGNLVGVAVMLQEGARADDVGKQLRAKYGKPTRKETAHYQNNYGAHYEVDNLEWTLPGLHVAYNPGPLGGGAVIIETEMGQKARKAKEDTEESKQPKL